jgi:hypothetical protein
MTNRTRAEKERKKLVLFCPLCMLLRVRWVRRGSTHPTPAALICADQRVPSRFQKFFLENEDGWLAQYDVWQCVRARKQKESAEAI